MNMKNILFSVVMFLLEQRERGNEEGREDGGFGWREGWPAALLCSL